MKNFKQSGESLVITAPSGGFTSGTPALVGKLFVVPKVNAAEGVPAACQIEGVIEIDKTTGTAWAVGDELYWAAGTGKATKTVSTNSFIGHAAGVAASGDAVGLIRLQPSSPVGGA